MSTYKSLAGVSQSLANLLGDRMVEPAAITLAPPDVDVDQVNPPRLNIYLYHLSENAFLKNQEIPGDGHPGAYGHPPLSLNLHYILTAFGGQSERGADADIQAQFILGDAMRVLHDNAIISANLMQLKSPGKTVLDLILLDEFEQIKLTLQPKSLEEISKIWTALPRVNFRRSVTYEVSVVQIRSQQQRTVGLPVRERRVYAVTMRSPRIDEIFVEPPPLPGLKTTAAQEGETLRLTGHNLKTPTTAVTIDGVGATITALQDDQIDLVVPAGLAIGLHSLQVVQPVMLSVIDGHPLRGAFSSNVVGFQLVPTITGATRDPVNPNLIRVSVTPAVKSLQERTLLLGDHVVPGVPPQPRDPPTNTILFQLPQPPNDPIPPGQYLMRVRIDGAESRLQVDLDPNNPKYIGPPFILS